MDSSWDSMDSSLQAGAMRERGTDLGESTRDSASAEQERGKIHPIIRQGIGSSLSALAPACTLHRK